MDKLLEKLGIEHDDKCVGATTRAFVTKRGKVVHCSKHCPACAVEKATPFLILNGKKKGYGIGLADGKLDGIREGKRQMIEQIVDDLNQLDMPLLNDKGSEELLLKIRMRWQALKKEEGKDGTDK